VPQSYINELQFALPVAFRCVRLCVMMGGEAAAGTFRSVLLLRLAGSAGAKVGGGGGLLMKRCEGGGGETEVGGGEGGHQDHLDHHGAAVAGEE
jgi:hypothetical protein